MEYLTTEKAAKKWGISSRRVRILLTEGRVPGARKQGGVWLIPATGEKPDDLSNKRNTEKSSEESNSPSGVAANTAFDEEALYSDIVTIMRGVTKPLPLDDPDYVIDTCKDARVRLQYEAGLAYMRGNFEQTLECYRRAQVDDIATRICLASFCLSAVISLGDEQAFEEIDSFLKEIREKVTDERLDVILEYFLCLSHTHVHDFEHFPSWIKYGELEKLPYELRADAVYRRTHYLLESVEIRLTYEIAKTSLDLYNVEAGISYNTIYTLIMLALGFFIQNDVEQAKGYLKKAMHMALPYGFISPFAEFIHTFGGLMERCLEEDYPEYIKDITSQRTRVFKHYVKFHNRFTGGSLTDKLTLREYEIAFLIRVRIPYTAIAQLQNISEGRVNNIARGIYRKLGIASREELEKYIV